MDVLRPGHAHRSSSDRLLNNYLESQKSLNTSLLTLLAQSHSSTSSLLAYVTSSPGVLHPVRRSVRHAGFEGPLSAALAETHGGSHLGSVDGDAGAPGWAAYLSSLDRFRKDLKQIHLLEEEMSRVKRDREILVTRLIKTTKSRPTRSDLSAIASSYSEQAMSSRASTLSVTSAGSSASKEGKRAGKLADAQAELLGCEEHLRSLEVRIEHERNKVMMRGLEERFRAMDVVGRMWVSQSKKGLADLEKAHELPDDAFELDSNPSIAPSQSASQIGEDNGGSRRGKSRPKRKLGPGSITGSIAEEDENGSSDDGARGNLVMHENRPGVKSPSVPSPRTANKPSPLGVPSVNSRARPLSSTFSGSNPGLGNADDSDSDAPAQGRRGGRRAASDIGAMSYHPPKGREPLRRTFSNDQAGSRGASPKLGRRDSDTSIAPKKKKGFFASIGRLFKGPSGGGARRGSILSGRESPPYGSSNKGGWSTRTDTNIKRSGSAFGRRGGNDSSSDEDEGNLVSVSNNRNSWSVDNVGRPSGMIKRNSNTSVPIKPTRSDLGASKRGGSQSTLTGRTAGAARASTPAGQRPLSPTLSSGRKTPTTAPVGSVARSGTAKSTTSVGTAKSSGTIKKKPAQNKAITQAAVGTQQAAEGRNIMSLVDMKAPPAMPEVPKAPKSQVTPHLELAKAPGSSIQTFPAASRPTANGDAKPAQNGSTSQRNAQTQAPSQDPPRSNTPLPPSRSMQAPLKSALRPTSPSPPQLSPPIEPPKSLFTIAAPGPVQLPREVLKPIPIPAAAPKPKVEIVAPAKPRPPPNLKRGSFQSMTTDGESVYMSADEGENDAEAEAGHDGHAGVMGTDTSDSEDDLDGYDVVDNSGRDEVVAGPPEVVRIPADRRHEDDEDTGSEGTATAMAHPDHGNGEDRASHRKSVRITAPDSPIVEARAPAPVTDSTSHKGYVPDISNDRERAASPPPERPTDAQWNTRIGFSRDDDSDDGEDDVDEYQKVRRRLIRDAGKLAAIRAPGGASGAGAGGVGGKKKVGKTGSVKSGRSLKI